MLPIYLDISEKAKKVINKNVWTMFDLLLADCQALSYEEILSGIYPGFLIDNNLNLCKKVVHELSDMAIDSFERDYLKPIYEYALFQTIEWWIEVTDDIELDEITKEESITSGGDNLYQYINDEENYIDFMFEDWDFLYVHRLFKLYKDNPIFLDKFLHVNISEYIELMPNDIREEYVSLSKKKIIDEKKVSEENYIIKRIYNVLQRESMKPIHYEKFSEVELSDAICSILYPNFKEHNLDIEREARAGYSLIDEGELDFYIYQTENDLYKQIAIGENKIWGKYENSIKQVLGYMTENTKFGFVIIYNTNTQLKTVLQGRNKILSKFNVDGNFSIVGDITELEEMPDVLVTKHENPEHKGTYFNLYHFIFNIYRPERKKAAEDSRTKKKK